MIFPGPIHMIDYRRPLQDRAKARKHVGPYEWTPTAPGKGRGFYQHSKALAMDPHGSSFALRLSIANDHFPIYSRARDVLGYYCDQHGDETLQPIVARLPHGRGFLAGWTMGRGMCATVGADIYDTAEEAARAAHSMAEYDAERHREEQEQDEEEA